MKRKTPLAPVGHMLECAEWAISYIDGMGKEDFLEIAARSRPSS